MSVVRVVGMAVAVLVWLEAVSLAGPVYFVVAERPGQEEHGDSFVLPLTGADDIAHARDLIARGPEAAGAPLVFAEVSPGADGINRNVLADGQPLWNWHVSGFEGFADGGIELVDGWPTFIEGDVGGWMANTRRDRDDPDAPGHIGFWNYTVVAELDDRPSEVPLPPAVFAAGALLVGLVGRCELRRRRSVGSR
jgi:hypothetical protein